MCSYEPASKLLLAPVGAPSNRAELVNSPRCFMRDRATIRLLVGLEGLSKILLAPGLARLLRLLPNWLLHPA